jgi:hypothetical protein
MFLCNAAEPEPELEIRGAIVEATTRGAIAESVARYAEMHSVSDLRRTAMYVVTMW